MSFFEQPSQRSKTGLDAIGLTHKGQENWNWPATALIESAIRRGEGQLVSSGALATRTGKRTGRSPKDKFIVREPSSEKNVYWGETNAAIDVAGFDRMQKKAFEFAGQREIFVQDLWCGANPRYRLKIRVVSQYAWHALFARQLFIRPPAEELANFTPDFTVVDMAECLGGGAADGLNSETFVLLNFPKKLVVIGGTQYAGEIKKSIFTIMNYLLPLQGVMSMHCSANIGAAGDTALFFGLSGTGKTTLSADPNRRLIGDDEHGWGDDGVFNYEGGCYAKVINLSRQYEPQIYEALRFGTVLENVVIDPATRGVKFEDGSITENTRAAYPLDFIANAVEPSVGGHPRNIVFLTCDAFGVLPPISRLTPQQAEYHFLSGYTAKIAGTEAGLSKEPQATFSTCFGAPFMVLDPAVYATLLGKKIAQHKSRVWLLNTGWSGGAYGVGSRMKLPYTRALVNAALSGKLDEAPTAIDPVFKVAVPTACPDVPTEVLNPRNTWSDKSAYDAKARELAERFQKNFTKFPSASAETRGAGPGA